MTTKRRKLDVESFERSLKRHREYFDRSITILNLICDHLENTSDAQKGVNDRIKRVMAAHGGKGVSESDFDGIRVLLERQREIERFEDRRPVLEWPKYSVIAFWVTFVASVFTILGISLKMLFW